VLSRKKQSMNRAELFNEVKGWLEAERLAFVANEEDARLQLFMNLETGLSQIHLICEESPSMLQVVGALPVKVPQNKIAAAGLLLHSLNLGLRIGAFQFIQEERIVTFHLSFPIRSECDYGRQFDQAFSTALGTVDEHLQILALFCCSTDQAQAELEKLTSGDASLAANSRMPPGGLKLN